MMSSLVSGVRKISASDAATTMDPARQLAAARRSPVSHTASANTQIRQREIVIGTVWSMDFLPIHPRGIGGWCTGLLFQELISH
jgi:hypothetical protein